MRWMRKSRHSSIEELRYINLSKVTFSANSPPQEYAVDVAAHVFDNEMSVSLVESGAFAMAHPS